MTSFGTHKKKKSCRGFSPACGLLLAVNFRGGILRRCCLVSLKRKSIWGPCSRAPGSCRSNISFPSEKFFHSDILVYQDSTSAFVPRGVSDPCSSQSKATQKLFSFLLLAWSHCVFFFRKASSPWVNPQWAATAAVKVGASLNMFGPKHTNSENVYENSFGCVAKSSKRCTSCGLRASWPYGQYGAHQQRCCETHCGAVRWAVGGILRPFRPPQTPRINTENPLTDNTSASGSSVLTVPNFLTLEKN